LTARVVRVLISLTRVRGKIRVRVRPEKYEIDIIFMQITSQYDEMDMIFRQIASPSLHF
jgi:hypothetical protein